MPSMWQRLQSNGHKDAHWPSGRRICEHSENFNKDLENIKKKKIRAEEYNNSNEKYTQGKHKQVRGRRRTDQRPGRQDSINTQDEQQKGKNLKNEDSLREP